MTIEEALKNLADATTNDKIKKAAQSLLGIQLNSISSQNIKSLCTLIRGMFRQRNRRSQITQIKKTLTEKIEKLNDQEKKTI